MTIGPDIAGDVRGPGRWRRLRGALRALPEVSGPEARQCGHPPARFSTFWASAWVQVGRALPLRRRRSGEAQNVTQRFVHEVGVLVPDTRFVTVTPVPVGMKFTAPGPSVTFV